MNSKKSILDFEILGYKVKLRETEEGKAYSPHDVVDLVRERSNELLSKMPHLSRGEAAVLVALTLAQEKIELSHEFRDNIDTLRATAGDALQFIEEVSPSTI